MTIPQTINSPVAIAAPSAEILPVPSTDDEQQRRGYLLRVLLLIVGLGSLLLIFASNISSFLEPDLATLMPELVGLLVTGVCYSSGYFLSDGQPDYWGIFVYPARC